MHIGEEPEFGRQAAEGPNQCYLRRDDSNDEAEAQPAGGREVGGGVVEIRLGGEGGGEDKGQDVHKGEQIRVPRRRQIDESLDRTLSDALPEGIVFRANLLLTGMS